MDVKPLGDRVIVKRLKGDEVSAGGIIIPDTAKERPDRGEVLAVGPGALVGGERQPIPVAVGDKVLFGKYSGTDVLLDGEELLVVREDDLLVVLS